MLYYPNRRILKSLGLFENLAFVIMSTRENIRLIARASLARTGGGKLKCFISLFKQRLTDNYVQNLDVDYKHTAELFFF